MEEDRVIALFGGRKVRASEDTVPANGRAP